MKTIINYVRGITKRIALKQFGAITHINTDKKIAALSFDDGPNPVYTPELLKVLKNHNAKGTFFIVGKNAAKYPKLVDSIFSEGHAIGNHSFNHTSFTFICSRERRKQIRLCRNMIKKYDSKLFRPPYGNMDIFTHIDIRFSGYKIIMWNVVMQDWLEQTMDTIYLNLKNRLKPGSIILLHDNLYTAERESCYDRAPMINALDKFLNDNISYDFITVPELLRQGDAVVRFWEQKGDIEYNNQLIESN